MRWILHALWGIIMIFFLLYFSFCKYEFRDVKFIGDINRTSFLFISFQDTKVTNFWHDVAWNKKWAIPPSSCVPGLRRTQHVWLGGAQWPRLWPPGVERSRFSD
jgi:hypothetical protein